MKTFRLSSYLIRVGTIGSLLIALVLALTVHAADHKVPIRVVVPPDDYPICFTNAVGRPEGFAVDLLRALYPGTTDNFDFHVAEWSQARLLFLTNGVDIAAVCGGLAPFEDRMDASIPYLTVPYATFVRKDIVFRTVDDLAGRTIAMQEGSEAAAYLQAHPVRGARLAVFPSIRTVLLAILAGKADCGVVPYDIGNAVIGRLGLTGLAKAPFEVVPIAKSYRFVIGQGNRRLGRHLGDGLAQLQQNGTRDRLYSRWRSWADRLQKRAVIVGGDRAFPPFEFLDANGAPAGFDVDLVKAVAAQAGLKTDIRLDAWDMSQAALERGNVDILCGYIYSRSRAARFIFSRPIFNINYVPVCRPDTRMPKTPEQLAGMRVAMEDGGAIQDFLEGRTDIVRVRAENINSACGLVLAGVADCVLAPRLSVLQLFSANSRLRAGLVVGATSLYRADYCFAARLDGAELIAELDGALQAVKDSGQYRRIREDWLARDEPEAPRNWRAIFRQSLPVVLPGFGLIVFLLLVVLFLRVRVNRRTAEAQRAAEERRRVLDCVADPIFAVDREGLVLFCNHAAETVFGWSERELVGHDCPVITPELRTEFLRVARDCVEIHAGNYVYNRRDGSPISVRVETRTLHDAAGRAIGIVGVVADMTETNHQAQQQLRLSDRLREAEKLESIGQLAGGIAHDFNNYLQIILGYCELLQDRSGPPPAEAEMREDVDAIADAARRSAALTTQLLSFSRRQVLDIREMDINRIVNGMTALLRRAVGTAARLDFRAGGNLPHIRADAGQIGQILMNLCVNARDALPGGGGEIAITTGLVTLDTPLPTVDAQNTAPAGRYVRLAVSDTGSGIPPDVLKRIFEPFFTTKPRGKGTGLGLSTVYGLVRQHKAFLVVDTVVGKGTTFAILFPAVETAPSNPAGAPAAMSEPGAAPAAVRHDGAPVYPLSMPTVLLAEDNPSVRAFAAKILERAGYRVISAADGAEAIRIYDNDPATITAAVLDIVMPNVGGYEVYQHIRRNNPGKAVVFASGYDPSSIHSDFVLEPGLILVKKPYQPAELLAKLHQAIENARGAFPKAGGTVSR